MAEIQTQNKYRPLTLHEPGRQLTLETFRKNSCCLLWKLLRKQYAKTHARWVGYATYNCVTHFHKINPRIFAVAAASKQCNHRVESAFNTGKSCNRPR